VLEAFRVLVAAFTAAVSLISHVSSKVKLTVNPQRLIVFRRT
jgi:hypothetical protein